MSWFTQKVDIPSKEELERRSEEIRKNEENQNNQDCEYMMNLLNKTMKSTLTSPLRYHHENIDKSKIYKNVFIDIRKCKNYKEYEDLLKERNVKLNFYQSSYKDSICYDTLKKELTIRTRWLSE